MADRNPWSAEDWSITEQGRYAERYGRARAEARARDAGTFFGGPRPLSPAQRAARGDPANPWSLAGYNVTAQIEYERKCGRARAEARARDAGTTMAQAALIRPHDPAIYKIPGKGYAIPHRKPRDVLLTAHMSLGLSEAATLSMEADVTDAFSVGIEQAVTLALSIEIAAGAGLGLTQAVALDFETHTPASAVIGIAQAVSLDFEVQAAASMELGLSQAVTLSFEVQAAAAATVGITQTVSLYREQQLAAAASVGIAQAVTLYLELDLSASAEIGVTMAAAVTTISSGPHRITTASDIRGLVGGDQRIYIEDANARVTDDGTTRVTGDGAYRDIG